MDESLVKNEEAALTPEIVQLKITSEIVKEKLTIADLEKRALAIEKNEDSLKTMAALFADLDKVEEIAEAVHAREKRPHLDAGKACDQGKKLVLTETDRIRSMLRPDYDRMLAAIDQRKRQQEAEKRQQEDVLRAVEGNIVDFANMIVAATTLQELRAVESLINLQKTPSMAKNHGEFHEMAIERYNTVLIPVIKEQKKNVERLEELKNRLQQAEDNNDIEKMELIDAQINELSNEMLQNHAEVQDAVLKQAKIQVQEAEEVLPDFKVRTDFTFEIADLEAALKKSRELLTIEVNNKAARKMLEKLKEENAFEGKDELIVNGIKYIANRKREVI